MTNFLFTEAPQHDPTQPDGYVEELCKSISFSPRAWHFRHRYHQYALAATRVDDPTMWAPYYDPNTKRLFVLAGRAYFDGDDADRVLDNATPEERGLTCQLIAQLWREDERATISRMNGACALLVLDENQRSLKIVTDRLGAFPVFTQDTGRINISTHPDALFRTSGLPFELDYGTVAEMFAFGGSVHPYTYHQRIQQLDAASVYTWRLDTGEREQRVYWEPNYQPESDLRTVTEQIQHAIGRAVRRRTRSRYGRSAIFLSGGADSRAVLFSADDPSSMTAITFYAEDSRELAITKHLVERAGARHILLQRDDDYYFRSAEDVMRIAGGMWNIWDAHAYAATESIANEEFGSMLSGCYADYMFKGLLQNRAPMTLFGKHLGLEKRGDFNLWFYLWRRPISEKWSELPLTRLRERLEGVTTPPANDAQRLALEARRLIPLACEGDWLFRGLSWRTLPWDLLFADNDIVDAYLKLPIKYKLNGVAFRAAVNAICKQAEDIPNANDGRQLSEPKYRTVARTLYRQFAGKGNGQGASTAADFRQLILDSQTLQDQWNSTSKEDREIVVDVLGESPWDKPLSHWATQYGYVQFYRMFSFLVWLRTIR